MARLYQSVMSAVMMCRASSAPTRFERSFSELVVLGGVTGAEPEAFAELRGRYELEVDRDSILGLVERFYLRCPCEPV